MLVDRPPAGPGWAHEVKGDGYRLLARNEGQRVTLCTRYGTKFTDRLPRIAEAVRGLPADQALVDGEAVVFRREGLSDSEVIGTKAGAATAAYIAFDLLQPTAARGSARRARAHRERLRRHPILRGYRGQRPDCLRQGMRLGCEGIVSKRVGSVYWRGRCRNWTKTRNPASQRR
jgi:bifunctional non-homologous end joining protein LigD